jgi:hypothetical protein
MFLLMCNSYELFWIHGSSVGDLEEEEGDREGDEFLERKEASWYGGFGPVQPLEGGTDIALVLFPFPHLFNLLFLFVWACIGRLIGRETKSDVRPCKSSIRMLARTN